VSALVTLVLTVVVLTTSPIFALKTIEITGLERLDEAEVRSRIDSLVGTPLAQVSPQDVVDLLAEVPLVQSVETRVDLPNTLVVSVVERLPLGAIQTPTGFEVVDGAAVVLWSSSSRPSEFPVILVPASQESEEFVAVVAALTSLPPDVLSQVDAVTAASTDTVRFSLRDSNHVVLWGSAELSVTKARALPAALVAAGSTGQKLIDLSTPETVVIREVD
jgi:cell division protein FtsQ